MRLVRFGLAGEERPGILLDDDTIVDIGDDVDEIEGSFLESGGVERLRSAIETDDGRKRIAVADTRLGPPLANISIVVCIGLNYSDHARESGAAPPSEPIVFLKAPSTVIGPDDDVIIPRSSEKTDWEVELGVVIGRRTRYLDGPEQALEHIAGFVLSNDVSEREFQLERGGQWDKGKSCETFNPLGPWFVTADEVPDPQQLGLWCDVNGERMQDGNTSDMIFDVDHLVWYLSQFMVLQPGDVINTGTPAGVGLGLDPPRYLNPGDTMTLGISGLGQQHHRCIAAS